jgi:hypothetical protein
MSETVRGFCLGLLLVLTTNSRASLARSGPTTLGIRLEGEPLLVASLDGEGAFEGFAAARSGGFVVAFSRTSGYTGSTLDVRRYDAEGRLLNSFNNVGRRGCGHLASLEAPSPKTTLLTWEFDRCRLGGFPGDFRHSNLARLATRPNGDTLLTLTRSRSHAWVGAADSTGGFVAVRDEGNGRSSFARWDAVGRLLARSGLTGLGRPLQAVILGGDLAVLSDTGDPLRRTVRRLDALGRVTASHLTEATRIGSDADATFLEVLTRPLSVTLRLGTGPGDPGSPRVVGRAPLGIGGVQTRTWAAATAKGGKGLVVWNYFQNGGPRCSPRLVAFSTVGTESDSRCAASSATVDSSGRTGTIRVAAGVGEGEFWVAWEQGTPASVLLNIWVRRVVVTAD